MKAGTVRHGAAARLALGGAGVTILVGSAGITAWAILGPHPVGPVEGLVLALLAAFGAYGAWLVARALRGASPAWGPDDAATLRGYQIYLRIVLLLALAFGVAIALAWLFVPRG